jgi:hypothetical protein
MIPTIDQVALHPMRHDAEVIASRFAVSPDAQAIDQPRLEPRTFGGQPQIEALAPTYSFASYENAAAGWAGGTAPSTLESSSEALANSSSFVLEPSGDYPIGTRGDGSMQARRTEREREFRFRNWLARQRGSDLGLGYERVMFAPMVLDTAISSSYVGTRIRADRGLSAPDRLEYLWSRAGGRGPDPESRVDLIDTMYRTELGNANAALISEIGMRALNPEVNPNTVGFADMLLGGKALVYDGKCTKVATLFLTHLNTGPTNRGLGTGHVSLEPGLLVRHQWSEATFLHGELKYRLPIAGTAGFAGDVLSTGWGVSTVWRDSDSYALIPTLEMRTHSFLFGGMTRSDGTVQRVDGVTAIELYPGMRCTFNRSSVGTWELGFGGGSTFADSDWFDSRMILDVRLLR